MSKIFRLHTGAGENVEHWQEIPGHLSDNFINSIEDPSGSTAHTQITSIPSPFARMDLVRTAFRFVNNRKALDGTTIYHRMVSDCLDVAEIFFNIEALHDKIELLEWNSGIIMNGGQLDIDANSDLGKLINSFNSKHKLLGETLKMFLFQDQKAFNFSELKHCYLLNYKHGPELINIIGGTSPATLFFSSANDLSFVDISFANDRVFDNKYFPLYKRGRDFIKFFYSLRVAFPYFSEKFPDLNTYLDLTFETLDDKMKDTIRSMKGEDYLKDYIEIIVHTEGNYAEILGTKLRTKNYGKTPTEEDNEFTMESSRAVEGPTPLVLPNEPFNEPLKYAGGVWQKTYHENVPYADERPLNERTLPNQTHIKYPYLTVSDLLEPYLIKLPYPPDSEKFFNGNYEYRSGEKDHGFVLPIKKKFFEYFTIEDLQGTVADGKKRFELLPLPAGVKAVLRIPIKNNRYIQFTRLYALNQFHDKIQKANEHENQGIITENQFTLAIYPFIKLSSEINPHYRVLLVDRDISPTTKHLQYSLTFYDENNPTRALQFQSPRLRSNKQHVQKITTSYHIIENSFSFIEISNNNNNGLLVPLFKSQPVAAKAFKFAIDFGTTNTHVEYKMGTEEARPFDITEKDVQVGTLHTPTEETEKFLKNPKLGFGADDLINIIKEEFLPFIIGQLTQYKFPQRTVISDNGTFNPNEANFALADFNIPFWYLKEDLRLSSEITPNLKWIDFTNDLRLARRTKAFLKQLFLMIRNKVLLNGGDLASTEIVWFYPSSMPKFRRDFLQRSWEDYYHRYFPNAAKLNKMSESFAPFYYYYHKENVRPHDRPAVSIDIGGGTTDIVIYQSENPIVLTSFTFAANSIFGDGYGNTSAYNGFVQRYEGKILEALAGTSARKLTEIYDNLKRKNGSSIELIEFFFSLEDNKLIKDNKIPMSFSNMLNEDNDMKLVFILFYAAIIYHVARVMKAKQLPIPEYITFSGNGSKVIKLAGGGSDLSTLLEYTKVIFEDVYEMKSPSIEFRFFKNPKEITSKGGLECTEYTRFEKLEKDIKTVLLGTDMQLIPPVSLHYSQIENHEIISGVCQEVALFIEKFFNWNNKFNYYQNFGINPKGHQEYRELLKTKIKVDLISGIKEKQKETHNNVDIDIEETLFFYPIAGALNRLAYKIQSNIQVKTANT